MDASYNYNGIDDAKQNKKHIIGIIDDTFYYNSECYKTSDTSYIIAFYTFKNDGSNLFPISALSYVVTPTSVSLDRSYNLGLTTSGSGYGLLSDDGNYRTLKTINGQEIFGSGDIAIEGGETVTEADITAMGFTKNAGTITGVSANGTSVATSGVANIPAASTSKYGVTKLSSATNSSSTSLAATASAVKAAYDLAKGKVSESDIFDNKTDGIIKAEALYNDKSQGGLIYALPTSRLALEDNCDDVLVVRSEIFAGSPEQSMLQADAFYETTTGTIYGLPTSSIVTNGGEDEIIATQGYVDDAVANAGGAYNLTSLTKAQLDSFTSGSTITINANDVSAIRANKIITITSNSGRCLMAAWSAQSSSVVQLTFLCDNVVYIAKASLQSNGTAKINAVAKHLVDANSGGGGSSSGSGAYAEVNHGTSDTTFTLTPNTFHIWDEVANLTLTLGSETSGVANEFLFQFTSGATATSLALPDDIKWVSELAVEPNMIYQVSILKGLASVLEFNNAIVLIDNLCTYDGNKTVTFQYPVASDVSVYIGSSINMSTEVQLSAGETTATLVGMAEPGSSIVAINPMRDDTYNYIF